ncbi:putative bifunctional diguanylate cyclase/phosphodiesterase [Poseidonocella pacifica]|nr:EAL domain-containing protein [Poseidonocella pacifica]
MLSVVGALIFGIAYFAVSTWEVSRVERSLRSQLIEMTNGFVSVFDEHRGEGAPVPAKFRRLGIEQFTNSEADLDTGVRTSVRMPGRPGLELQTIEDNVRIGQIIQQFVDGAITGPVREHRIEDGRLIGRTIYPSVASSESCVSCHNEALGRNAYQIGDIMGAFVVESDLTAISWRNAHYSVAAFGIALIAFGALARRERGRMGEIVSGLEARVLLETEKAEAEAHASFLMSHDALTGLPNRTMFSDHLTTKLANRHKTGISVAVLDLDDFKTVNDTMGHEVGDALLTEAAKRLSVLIKDSDSIVSRLGGDEFAVVFQIGDLFQSSDAAGRAIMQVLTDVFAYSEYVIQPKCSVGIATICNDADKISPTELLRFADAALYEAKKKGKNHYKIFNETIRSSLIRRTEIASQLPDAIIHNEIRAALQPKLCLTTGEFMGFEALGRWQLAGEDVSPAEFVPIAEKIGLIRELDLAVLRSAAEFAAREEAETGICVHLSTNISALNFRSTGLAEAIQDILWQTKLRPDRVTLEVTESAAVENWGAVQDVLAILRPMGVRASLDDFGTGYSSLSYLRRFKFEEIKIDRHFISDIVEDQETRFLFESIVDMAEGLGSSLVVEGIETAEQASIVAEKGALIGQGFLFSRPLEIAEAKAYLRIKNSFDTQIPSGSHLADPT